MNRLQSRITPESIVAEFPAVTVDTAEDLTGWIQAAAAAANVLDILRSCPAEAVEQAIAIIIEQMDCHDAELLHSMEPAERTDFGDSIWLADDGFTEVRTQVIRLACSDLGQTQPEVISKELERLDPWICQLDTMRLTPKALNWQDCIVQSQLWQRHVIERDYDANTAELLGSPDGKLAAWNSLADPRKMGDLIIAPIHTQEELATESALNEPDIYRRYVNRCIANAARPFVVIEDRTGQTRTLCVLRKRRGRWQLSTPTWQERDQSTIEQLKRFAGIYQALEHEAGPNAHQSWRRHPGEPVTSGRKEKQATAHRQRCQRCDQPQNASPTRPTNTPGRCERCWREYQERTEPQPEPAKHSASCSACGGRTTDLAAMAGKRNVKICATCELISREYAIFELETDFPLKVMHCKRCGGALNRLNYELTCQPCQEIGWQERRDLQAIITYLYDTLDTRRAGTEASQEKPPPAVRNASRSDMTTLRKEAGTGRLNPELSVELCREYVAEGRHIPELALRFGASIETVRKTLRGQSWEQHTAGHRPAKLRAEPPRIRLPKPATEQTRPAYITVSRLKSRFGWTDRLIRAHLKEHDREAPNPHYRSAAPMRLYLIDRVQAVTAADWSLQTELQNTLNRRKQRSNTQQERTLNRRTQLIAQTEQLEPVMLALPTKNARRLMELATKAREQSLAEREWYDEYDHGETQHNEDSAVNMVRHKYTNYELLLEMMPPARDVETNILIYHTVKRKTLEMIAKNIPQLRATCEQQIADLQPAQTLAGASSQTTDRAIDDGHTDAQWARAIAS